MFTGLIEEVGRVRVSLRRGGVLLLDVEGPVVSDRLSRGDSIAVSGVCLTVEEVRKGGFRAAVVGETESQTYLPRLRAGDPVNLERSLRLGDRLGGHLVQGHVDGVGKIASLRSAEKEIRMSVLFSSSIGKYIVEKGSVALDGVSLTVASVGRDSLEVALVPVTWEKTAFRKKRRGDPVHIEVDVMGKYVERMLGERSSTAE